MNNITFLLLNWSSLRGADTRPLKLKFDDGSFPFKRDLNLKEEQLYFCYIQKCDLVC